MINICLNLPDTALTRFLSIVHTLGITDMSLKYVQSAVPTLRRPKRKATKTAKTTKTKVLAVHKRKPQWPKLPGALDVAIGLISSTGTAPFKIKDIIARASRADVSGQTVYTALNREIKAGNVKKLGTGLYQRTAAGFLQQQVLDEARAELKYDQAVGE